MLLYIYGDFKKKKKTLLQFKNMERITVRGIHTVQGCLEVIFLSQFNAAYLLSFTRQQATISFKYLKLGFWKVMHIVLTLQFVIVPQLPIIHDMEFVNNLEKLRKQ